MSRFHSRFISVAFGLATLAMTLAACTGGQASAGVGDEPFVISAIPDQDPEKLQRRYGLLTEYLETALGTPVEYKPVIDYAASVTAFRVGDVDMVWFGGLTGVQARLQVDGAQAIAQRDFDADFHSVFIANRSAGIEPISDAKGLAVLKGHTFTFGSESSTSGRLMPQAFLSQAGVSLEDFEGEVGFSGSHDATIDLVEAGSYEVGALNEQVWERRVEAGEVDLERVELLWQTPAFADYHWVISPEVEDRYGEGFIEQVQQAFLALDPADPEQAEILNLFGARAFISTENANYEQIESIARELGKIE
jgi:phosphonate transport system substrate-binding protein